MVLSPLHANVAPSVARIGLRSLVGLKRVEISEKEALTCHALANGLSSSVLHAILFMYASGGLAIWGHPMATVLRERADVGNGTMAFSPDDRCLASGD